MKLIVRLPLVGGQLSPPVRQKPFSEEKNKTKLASSVRLPLVGVGSVENSRKGGSAPRLYPCPFRLILQ